MEEQENSRAFYGLGGAFVGALIGFSIGLWGDHIEWVFVGLTAAAGLVLGVLAGKRALKLLTEILKWS